MVDGTSGRGASRDWITFTSSLDLCVASASTARWFSGVRCGARMVTVVMFTDPLARRSRMTGKVRTARAAAMRL